MTFRAPHHLIGPVVSRPLLLLALTTALMFTVPDSADATNLHEVRKLLASDARVNDDFGYSVEVSGDTAVIGAWLGGGAFVDSGAAYVFQRNEGGADNWAEVTKLIASDAQDRDHFGWRVGISGDTIIVAADGEDSAGTDAGAAYVFRRDKGGKHTWGEVTKLLASDAQDLDHFAWSVAISGDTAVVGAYPQNPDDIDEGAAYVFQRDEGGPNNWGEVQKLIASDPFDGAAFSVSVAISGDTVVVGACCGDSPHANAGAAYVFQRDGDGVDTWGEVQRLTASDHEAGDRFGWSVALEGDTLVVGAYTEDAGGIDSGAAYVFQRDEGGPNNWGEVQKLTASDREAGDSFGFSVAVSGDSAVVGAHLEDTGGDNAGAAYLFGRDKGGLDNWGELYKLSASDAEEDDRFGFSVAVGGDTAVTGAYREDDGAESAGAAYLFGLSGVKPTPTSALTSLPPPNATEAPTPGPTATPSDSGDASCDGTVNAVDAALVLQFSGALLGSLPCAGSADVNEDGVIDSLDVVLILQFTAGLLASLPP